jgi:hypothetical protein
MNKVDAARMEPPLSKLSSIVARSATYEVVLLLKLLYQLLHVAMNDRKRLAPFRRCSVQAPPCTAKSNLSDLQITTVCQPMQQRIERSRTYSITMTFKLFEHLESKNLFLDGVIQNMQLNKSGQQIFIRHSRQFDNTLSKVVNEVTAGGPLSGAAALQSSRP